ncbi:MAG TPA: zf-TFIIB domain-containing protein [Solirubrobacteraceae bacterium]|nr:zf-TFIIB domain-containing protein [Solirubrobacteraceae bacterium]
MICPKCQGQMRTYERNGIHVDQCTECRGLFLDRGELEHLVQAEGSFYGQADSSQRPQESHGHGTFHYKGHKHPKRKKHFLEELFD